MTFDELLLLSTDQLKHLIKTLPVISTSANPGEMRLHSITLGKTRDPRNAADLKYNVVTSANRSSNRHFNLTVGLRSAHGIWDAGSIPGHMSESLHLFARSFIPILTSIEHNPAFFDARFVSTGDRAPAFLAVHYLICRLILGDEVNDDA